MNTPDSVEFTTDEDIEQALWELVKDGRLDAVWDPDSGEQRFRVTQKGKDWVEGRFAS